MTEDLTFKMPSNYVDMSLEELEYDGGSIWSKWGDIISVGIIAVSAGLLVAAGCLTGGLGAGLAVTGVLMLTGGVVGLTYANND